MSVCLSRTFRAIFGIRVRASMSEEEGKDGGGERERGLNALLDLVRSLMLLQ